MHAIEWDKARIQKIINDSRKLPSSTCYNPYQCSSFHISFRSTSLISSTSPTCGELYRVFRQQLRSHWWELPDELERPRLVPGQQIPARNDDSFGDQKINKMLLPFYGGGRQSSLIYGVILCSCSRTNFARQIIDGRAGLVDGRNGKYHPEQTLNRAVMN